MLIIIELDLFATLTATYNRVMNLFLVTFL